MFKTKIILLMILLFLQSCSDKNENINNGGKFVWKEKLEMNDIPDIAVKGYINGEEVNFSYVNFERWRGSGDNVINFSVVKPTQNCGYVEGFRGFSLIKKGGSFKVGEWLKSDFSELEGYEAYYINNGVKSAAQWNCALRIDKIEDKHVNGSIVIFFNDDKKSWIAGKFEGLICNN